jgi:hypothetical protein
MSYIKLIGFEISYRTIVQFIAMWATVPIFNRLFYHIYTNEIPNGKLLVWIASFGAIFGVRLIAGYIYDWLNLEIT